jgi:hypothetical protein
MKKSDEKRFQRRRKVFQTAFRVFSLSGILFAFQACYGTPQDFGLDVLISGSVTSATSHKPIAGLLVAVDEIGQYTETGSDGTFSLHCETMPGYRLRFGQAGTALSRDTTVNLPEGSEQLVINIEL